jgi:hypothetical protein
VTYWPPSVVRSDDLASFLVRFVQDGLSTLGRDDEPG